MPRGAELFREVAETVAPGTAELFSGIAPRDLATAHDVLRQVIERAQQMRQ